MMSPNVSDPRRITTLFLDIGGVLLTNGWDRDARRRAADLFELDYAEMNERHHLTFDTYEEGKLTLDEYLARVVFHRERPFTPQAFREFMLAQSAPLSGAIEAFKKIKAANRLSVAALSNEGREITVYRIKTFGLRDLIDFFVCSCFVRVRKPDADIYRLALDIAQAEPAQSVYVDDRLLHVEVARSLGIRGIHHTGLEATLSKLAALGLSAR
jgi:putative hydrolase of the HAD superfamily